MRGNNKLIAEFMQKGFEGFGLYDYNGKHYKLYELKFHKSWDWLMPVIEKIEEIFIDDSNLIIKEHRYEFDMKYTQCNIYDHVKDCVVASGDMGNKLLSTYQAVVEFIKNQND